MQASGKTPSTAHHIVVLVLCVVVIAGCFLFRAERGGLFLFGYKWPFRCFLKETFGLKCALCGISRSLCLTARGDLKAALSYHPVGPFIFAFILWQLPYRIWLLKNLRDSAGARLSRINCVVAVVIVLAVFINWVVYLGRLII
jgi:hypothetical protein